MHKIDENYYRLDRVVNAQAHWQHTSIAESAASNFSQRCCIEQRHAHEACVTCLSSSVAMVSRCYLDDPTLQDIDFGIAMNARAAVFIRGDVGK